MATAALLQQQKMPSAGRPLAARSLRCYAIEDSRRAQLKAAPRFPPFGIAAISPRERLTVSSAPWGPREALCKAYLRCFRSLE